MGSLTERAQHSGESSEAVSKDEIHRALAFVSACYLHARPSRGSLRQVYNFLLQTECLGVSHFPVDKAADYA